MNLLDLVATIRIDLSDFERGLNSAREQAKNFSSNLGDAYSGIQDVLKPAVQGFQAVESVGKKAGDAIKKSVTGFTAAAAAVGGFGAAAVKSGMSFDATMSEVSAISGAAGKDFDSLRAKALEMGAKTKFSATEAAEAMTYMAMAGWKAGDMIGGIEGIMDLAAASGEDLASTSDIVTDALSAFGLQAKDSGRFADVLAAASTSANTNVGMMGETFKYVAPVAGALGYSAEDTAISIGLMANQGIKASQAGTSLRSILTRLATNAGETKTQMGALSVLTQELGVEFYNTDGTTRNLNDVLVDSRAAWAGLSQEQQISYSKIIAGQEAMSGWLALMNAAPADIEKVTTAIYDCDGAAKEMSKTMIDNLQGDLTLLGSAFESLQIAISDSLTPTLREFAQFGQKAMANLLEGFQSGGTTGFFSALTGIVTEGITLLAEKAPQFAQVSMQFIDSLATGILNARDKIIQSAAQIFMILVQGLDSWMSSHLSELLDFGKKIVDSLFQGFVSAGDVIAKYIGEFIPLIAEAFAKYHEALFTVGIDILGAIGRGIVENKGKIRETAKEMIANMVTALRDNAPDIIEGAVALLNALVEAVIANLPLILEAGAEIVLALVSGISGNLPAITVVVGLIIAEIVKVIQVVGNIAAAFNSLTSLFGDLGGAVTKLQGIVSSAISTVTGLGSKLMAGIQALWALVLAHPVAAVVVAIVAAITILWNKSEAFREFWIGAWEKCKEAFSAFADWCSEGVENLKQLFAEWRDKINEKFSDIGNWFRERFAGVRKSAVEAADSAKKKFDEFRKALDKQFGKIGDWFGEKFRAARKNAVSAWDNITDVFDGIVKSILGVFKMTPEEFKKIGTNIMKGFGDGIIEKGKWLLDKAKGIVKSIKNVFTNKEGFDTHSPSRWAKNVFAYVMEGGEQGLVSGSRDLIKTAKRAADDIKDNLQFSPVSMETENTDLAILSAETLEAAAERLFEFLESCREAFIEFGEWLKEQAQVLFEWFGESLDSIAERIAAAQESFLTLWDSIAALWSAAPEWFAEICENIRLLFETLTLAITELFVTAVTTVQETFAALPEAFTETCDALRGIWEQATTFFTETFTAAAEAVKEAWAAVEEFFAALWNAITAIYGEAPAWFGETFTAAFEAIQTAWEPVIPFFEAEWENIINVFSDAAERFFEIGESAMNGLLDGIESMKDSVIAAAEAVKQGIVDAFSDLAELLTNIANQAMEALSQAVYSKFDEMKAEVDELMSRIAAAISKLSEARSKTESLEKKAEKEEKAAEKKLEAVSKGVQKAAEATKAAAGTVKSMVSAKPSASTGKTPTQLLREENASYGKANTSGKTPSQINREEKASQKKVTLTPSQINRLDKALANGISGGGFGGGGASGSGAGRKPASSQIQNMNNAIADALQFAASTGAKKSGGAAKAVTKDSGRGGNVFNFTFNSPKAMSPTEAARASKWAAQQIALDYV